jgi:hypothetical protein
MLRDDAGGTGRKPFGLRKQALAARWNRRSCVFAQD